MGKLKRSKEERKGIQEGSERYPVITVQRKTHTRLMEVAVERERKGEYRPSFNTLILECIDILEKRAQKQLKKEGDTTQ